MIMAWPSPQLHSCTVDHNRGQPGGKLRIASELVQMLASRQYRVLHRVFGIGLVAQ